MVMKLPDTQPEQPSKMLDHDAGLGEASEDMVEARARELAKIAGLSRDESPKDFMGEARGELRGSVDPDSPSDDEGAIAGLSSYDEVPGESGMPVSPATNAVASGDEESIGEALYSEGISEATHDRMVESRSEELRDARDEEKE